MSRPEISIIVSTFERAEHLERSLLSIAHQQGVSKKLEVVVTDDGSRDATKSVVESFSRRFSFPITWLSTDHDGFRLARCRNRGALFSKAPYLLFIDGDCVLPLDHVGWHLHLRNRATAVCGDCYRLDQAATEQVTAELIKQGGLQDLVSHKERYRFQHKARRARIYSKLRFKMRPRMTGNNIGLWRSDFEAVNGFDEAYVGWGLEDTDLQRRLGKYGVRFQTILHRSIAYHLWHPAAQTFRRNGAGTANHKHFLSTADGPTRCRLGLDQHRAIELGVADLSNAINAARDSAA